MKPGAEPQADWDIIPNKGAFEYRFTQLLWVWNKKCKTYSVAFACFVSGSFHCPRYCCQAISDQTAELDLRVSS